ncbi:MAG: hypothetical protein Q7S76_03580 [bacterium]|nr:hypothetical protein [bacterium]
MNVVLALILFLSPVSLVQAQEQTFQIETAPGNTAVRIGADTGKSVIGPGGGILSRINALVRMAAILGSTAKNAQGITERTIKFPNLERPARIKKSIDPLYPEALQDRISLPQDHLEGNELFPSIAGRGCSDKSTTDTQGKVLEGAAVGETVKKDFYDALTSSTLLSGIFGAIHTTDTAGKYTGNGLPGLRLTSPRQEISTRVGDKNVLINPGVLYPCGSQSTGEAVREKDLKIYGDIASGQNPDQQLNVTIPQERYDSSVVTLANVVRGLWEAGKCAISETQCQAVQSLATSITATAICPGCPAQYGLVNGIESEDLPTNLSEDARRNLLSYKGWVNTFRPKGVTFARGLNEEDGTTNQPITGTAQASPEQATNTDAKLPWRGIHGVNTGINKTTDCLLIPASIQKGDCKEDPGTSVASTWAIQGTGTPLDPTIPSFFTGDFRDLLARAASSSQIPLCVLDAVAKIEGGDAYPEVPKEQCQVNACSAAGPMQFTTGTGPANDPTCSACGAGYCPNAWGTWGNNGNPCSYNDSLSAASRKLRNDGPLTLASVQSQKEQILNAGYRYYGSRKAVGRLGGCSYGEFLYKHCDPSYICTGSGG